MGWFIQVHGRGLAFVRHVYVQELLTPVEVQWAHEINALGLQLHIAVDGQGVAGGGAAVVGAPADGPVDPGPLSTSRRNAQAALQALFADSPTGTCKPEPPKIMVVQYSIVAY
jgi:hypothetical protein